MPTSSGTARDGRGIAVGRPRASDAIGAALRNAFDRDSGLPADMTWLLQCIDAKLDKTASRRRCR